MLPIATVTVEQADSGQVQIIMVSDVLDLRAALAALTLRVTALEDGGGGGGGGTSITFNGGVATVVQGGSTHIWPVQTT